MENYKRFGATLQQSYGSGDVVGANYAEYRMMTLLFGFIFALLFVNPSLMLWAMFLFGLGLMAEGFGKVALYVGMCVSAVLLLLAVIELPSGQGISSALYGVLTLLLARSEARKERIIKV